MATLPFPATLALSAADLDADIYAFAVSRGWNAETIRSALMYYKVQRVRELVNIRADADLKVCTTGLSRSICTSLSSFIVSLFRL